MNIQGLETSSRVVNNLSRRAATSEKYRSYHLQQISLLQFERLKQMILTLIILGTFFISVFYLVRIPSMMSGACAAMLFFVTIGAAVHYRYLNKSVDIWITLYNEMSNVECRA